ncbi:MAG TPA: class I SAM-dependent methyltransferase [Gemmatimonadaceae bacterium]|nr:class I SAM-dependent methyltransferase [Gemmatimonadaceae bacterium]
MLVPSVPVLSRTPMAAVLDVADGFIKRRHPEWARLPPASLRMRIGVRNRILRNHEFFIESARGIVADFVRWGIVHPASHVLELGCGCGRIAAALGEYLAGEGAYTGQDVDAEMIRWCQQHLQNDRFTFHHANIYNKVYNPSGSSSAGYRLPAGDGSTSLVVSLSVFTHLLYDDTAHYVRECARVLAPGGHLHMSLFLMDLLGDRLGDRWTFAHEAGNCRVESLRYPEAAVAYELPVIRDLLSANGFSIRDIHTEGMDQQVVIAVRD